MVTVKTADSIISTQLRDWGTEQVALANATGRVLAEDLVTDRDLPPYDRVTMDGIGISFSAFQKGIRSFHIKGIIAAGDGPINITSDDECLEIMTGAALPQSVDTVIRYEDLNITDGIASIMGGDISKGQSIHYKGKDKKEKEVVVPAGKLIDPAIISMSATVGKPSLMTKKLPKVVVISTGDELVAVEDQPSPYQIRQSNSHTIRAILLSWQINADILHIPDDKEQTSKKIAKCLQQYDVVLMSGGVSMGKFDLVPQVLMELGVETLFHKVQQRPGKPFWFGKDKKNVLVFAFPGNPVSTFMCVYRYFLPWLQLSLGLPVPEVWAVLDTDVTFAPALQYFMQVKLHAGKDGKLLALPVEGNGSGDFANLIETDAFMELPLERTNFSKGEMHRIWIFK
jgi:molybdopterin molybdotransferase